MIGGWGNRRVRKSLGNQDEALVILHCKACFPRAEGGNSERVQGGQFKRVSKEGIPRHQGKSYTRPGRRIFKTSPEPANTTVKHGGLMLCGRFSIYQGLRGSYLQLPLSPMPSPKQAGSSELVWKAVVFQEAHLWKQASQFKSHSSWCISRCWFQIPMMHSVGMLLRIPHLWKQHSVEDIGLSCWPWQLCALGTS